MKVCFIIFGHKNIKYVKYLARSLQHENFHIIMHVDSKSNLFNDYVESLGNYPRLKFSSRLLVEWGKWSFVDAIFSCLNEFLLTTSCDYVIFLTECDLFMKKPQELLDFLKKNKGTNFIQFFGKKPVKNWHNNNNNETDIMGIPLFGGSTFWTFTRKCVKFIINYAKQNDGFIKMIKNKIHFIPDEIVFPTIFSRSEFFNKHQDTLMCTVNDSIGCINSADIGMPIVYDFTDVNFLYKYDNKFFIRKSCNIPDEFINKLKFGE
jgi:hypothetical protein